MAKDGPMELNWPDLLVAVDWGEGVLEAVSGAAAWAEKTAPMSSRSWRICLIGIRDTG